MSSGFRQGTESGEFTGKDVYNAGPTEHADPQIAERAKAALRQVRGR